MSCVPTIWHGCLQPRPRETEPCQLKCLIIESEPVLFFEFLAIHIYLLRNWTLKKKKNAY